MKNFTDLTGKKAIVTGAAQGLCHGMAEGLMEAGAEVCIIDINPKTPEVAKEFCDRGFTCHSVIANLGDAESLKNLVQYRRQRRFLRWNSASGRLRQWCSSGRVPVLRYSVERVD